MKKGFLSTATLLLSLLLTLTACNGGNGGGITPNQPSAPQPGIGSWATGELPTNVTTAQSDLSLFDLEFSARDLNHTFMPASATKIEFSQVYATINGSGATVDESGTHVTITTGGSYIISGECSNGSITVDVTKGDKVSLLLNGLSLHSTRSPALYVRSAEKVTVTLVKDTENRLSDAEQYTYTDGTTVPDAAVFSKEDLCINGYGKLKVMGNMKHGIVSKDDLTITAGSLEVHSNGVALEGKDCVKIGGGTLTLTAVSDAIRSDNATEEGRGFVYLKDCTLTAHASNDGIQAANALIIEGGSINITTSGTTDPNASSKGIKSDSDIVIKGGTIDVTAAEDAVNSKKSVILEGGSLRLNATDEAIDADGDVIVRDGQINVTFANKAIKGEDVVIAGGTLTLLSNGDGINAVGEATAESSAGNILISGGYLWISAKKDCLDANTSIFITGGVTLIDGESTDKNVTLNANVALTVSGGVLVATGSQDTVKSVTAASNQGVMKVYFAQQSEGTPLVLCDAAGTAIVSFTPTKQYSAAVISAPELQNGGSYTLYSGGTVTNANANGYAANAPYTKGTSLGTVKFTTNFFKQAK